MGKLIRSLHAENIRLFSGNGAVLSLAAVFLIALCLSWGIAADSRTGGLLPASLTDSVNAGAVSISEEETEEYTEEEEIEEPEILPVISEGDISASDIISASDVPEEPVTEDKKYTKSWQNLYRERYSELLILNEEYTKLIEESSGREKGFYTAAQQECIREALIINKCLETDEEAGHSGTWNTIYITLWLMLLPIGIFSAAAISSKTAGEFKTGVMNTLYTLPVTRLKQYFAKHLSAALFALLLTATAWLGALFGAMSGFGGIEYKGRYFRVLGESVVPQSFFNHSAELAFCVFAGVLLLTAFSGAVSTLTRSQGVALALTAVLCASSMLFGKAAGGSGNIIAGLSVVSVLDVSAPIRGIPNYPSASYIVSWLCAGAYWLIFITCGYLGMRRDAR